MRSQTNRLEAFNDGVLAIIITIMVPELKVPHSRELAAIRPLFPVLLSYVLSFVYIGIYWNNHRHLLKAVKNTNAALMWLIPDPQIEGLVDRSKPAKAS